jgi:hypothetical protein
MNRTRKAMFVAAFAGVSLFAAAGLALASDNSGSEHSYKHHKHHCDDSSSSYQFMGNMSSYFNANNDSDCDSDSKTHSDDSPMDMFKNAFTD